MNAPFDMARMPQAPSALDYRQFLEAKARLAPRHGFDVARETFHPWLRPHAAACAQWAVAGGRRAIFARFGLAKTSMQLEIVRVIRERVGGYGLISPLSAALPAAAARPAEAQSRQSESRMKTLMKQERMLLPSRRPNQVAMYPGVQVFTWIKPPFFPWMLTGIHPLSNVEGRS